MFEMSLFFAGSLTGALIVAGFFWLADTADSMRQVQWYNYSFFKPEKYANDEGAIPVLVRFCSGQIRTCVYIPNSGFLSDGAYMNQNAVTHFAYCEEVAQTIIPDSFYNGDDMFTQTL